MADTKIVARPWQPQDLIDDLQGIIDEECDNYLNTRRTTLCMARDYLKEYFAEQKWIPVSEPPKVHGKYIALTPSKIRRDGYVTWYIRYDPENGWYDSDPEWGDIEMDDVAYWMPTPPLPQPPKGE